MANRVLLVALSLSVAAGVALASWARRGSESAPPPRPVAATPAVAPAAEWVDLGDDPPPLGDLTERIDPTGDPGMRKLLERMNWCGTGDAEHRWESPEPPSLEVPIAPDPDDSFVQDAAWEALISALAEAPPAVDRLARMRAYLVERAKTASRDDVVQRAHGLAGLDPNPRVALRLTLAAQALDRSDAAWSRFLDPPPPPPEPARRPGR